LQATDFELETVQVVAFPYRDELAPNLVLKQILSMYPDVYDGEITSLSLPADVPAEIPSVVIAAADNSHRIDVARSRLSVTWSRQDKANVDLQATIRTFSERIVGLTRNIEQGVGRLGCVVIRSAASEQPGRALAMQFCRDEWLRGPLNRPEGFELHAHKVFNLLPDLRVNSWVRIATAKVDDPDYSRVNVTQDINTLTEEIVPNRFTEQSTFPLMSAVSTEFDNIMRLYFPSLTV
jgi:hypothetical protein